MKKDNHNKDNDNDNNIDPLSIATTLTRTNLRGFFALGQYVGGLTKHGGLRRHGGLIATHERHPGAIYSKTSS